MMVITAMRMTIMMINLMMMMMSIEIVIMCEIETSETRIRKDLAEQ